MKTQRELNLEYWGRVHDMCTAYNEEYGTDIKPWECVKLSVNRLPFDSHPVFDAPYDYQFAVAILEGEPVFVGDKIFLKTNGKEYTVCQDVVYRQWAFIYGRDDIDQFTLTKPAPKRTFMLNGVELPCPVTGSTHIYPQLADRHLASLEFEFSTAQEGEEFMTRLRDMIKRAMGS